MARTLTRDAQKALTSLGYPCTADGAHGPKTQAALDKFCQAFQIPRQLIVTSTLVTVLTSLAALRARTSTPTPPRPPVARSYVQGCDVSSWQRPSEINYEELYQDGVKFVFVKATEGVTSRSKRLVEHWEQAGAEGFLRGAYHFANLKGHRRNQPREQAENLCSHVVKACGGLGELPLVLDAEWMHYKTKALREADIGKNARDFPATAVVDFCHDFGARVEELTGRLPILYTGQSFWKYRMAKTQALTHWLLWVAAYMGDGHEIPEHPPKRMTPPWDRVNFHQFAGGKGRAPDGDGDGEVGFTKPLDRNLFYGTLHELETLIA